MAAAPTDFAVSYGAKSTLDARGSIPTQFADNRGMAEREGWEIVDEYSDEAFSAWRGNRGPGLEQAMAHAERIAAEHGRSILVVQHSDRLARGDGKKARHLVELYFWATKHSIEIRSVQDDETFRNPLLAVVMGERNNADSTVRPRASDRARDGARRSAGSSLAVTTRTGTTGSLTARPRGSPSSRPKRAYCERCSSATRTA